MCLEHLEPVFLFGPSFLQRSISEALSYSGFNGRVVEATEKKKGPDINRHLKGTETGRDIVLGLMSQMLSNLSRTPTTITAAY